jgi:hypothetical protein
MDMDPERTQKLTWKAASHRDAFESMGASYSGSHHGTLDSREAVGSPGSPHGTSSSGLSPAKEFSKPDFSFLYTTSSAVIGSKVARTSGPMDVLLERPVNPLSVKNKHLRREEVHVKKEAIKADPEKILAIYHHEANEEDPRYTTANNEYGKRKPTVATFVSHREARPQAFSNSFNGIKPMNSSLNTGMSRSKVHPKLDPIV